MAETYYVKPENSPVNDLTLNSGDAMFIANGGTANGTIINSDGSATVNDGGSANNTTVNEGGTLHLIGGAATGVNVASNGRLEVNKGATATGIAAAKGATLVFDVAADTHIAGTSDGAAFLIQNGIATGFVLETGVLIVSEGGKAVETTLNSAGFINVSQGGSADKAVINTSGELKVSSGGTATEATVKTGGKITVESGGFCDDATIEMGGNLYVVSSGGTAAGTYIGAMGNLAVSKGGTAYGTTVGAGGFLTVGTKGIAEGADVNGFLNVLDGGTASNVTVNEGAVVYVQSKGTGSDVSVDYGGILEVLAGGRLKGATVAQGGSATIHADVMASNVVVDGGKVTVMSDGWAYQSGVSSNTIVQNGGRLIVSGGGYVVGAVVSAGGHVTVESDATFSSATVVAADVTALDGAYVSRLNLEAGGILNVVSGGKAEHINVSAGGVLTGILREASELKFYGGTLDLNIAGVSPESEALVDEISFLSIMPVAEDYLCTLTVSDTQAEGAYKLIEGASGFDTSKAITVKDTLGTTLGTLTVNGGSTTIGGVNYTLAVTTEDVLTVTIGEPGGNIISGDIADDTKDVPAGWSAVNVNVNANGSLNVLDGGKASSTTVNDGGKMYVSSGGVASSTTVNINGYLFLMKGGVASDTTVNKGGQISVAFTGVASNTTVSSGGSLGVATGGSATNITAIDGAHISFNIAPLTYAQGTLNGSAFEFKDAAVSDYTIRKGMTLNPMSGGSTSDVTVDSGGSMILWAGGVAKGTVVEVDGLLRLRSAGGIASDVRIEAGGRLEMMEGKLTGQMMFDDYAKVTVSKSDAIVDFDISALSPSNVVRLNNLSVISGTPTFTLTVGASQAEGTYNLAANASSFASDQTIMVVDTLGTELSTLTVAGGTKTIDGVKYTLALTDDVLTVTLGDGGGITPDITGDLNSDFELTAGMVGSSVNILDGGKLHVSNGGLAEVTAINAGGSMVVSLGGSASDTTVNNGGKLYVSQGGIASKTELNDGGKLFASGSVGGATVSLGGSMFVSSGATVNDINVSAGGSLWIYDGGTATGIVVAKGAELYFNVAPDMYVKGTYAESDFEMKDATLSDFTAWKKCTVAVRSGGVTSNTTLNDGTLQVDGGVAKDTVVKINGQIWLYGKGSVVSGVTFQDGCHLWIRKSGGKLTGKVTFETGAGVTYSDGASATLDFDLTQTTVGADALVNDLSPVLAAPFDYTLTVDGTEAAGDYNLAGGAAGFDKTITVVNTSGDTLGTLTVAGGKTTIDGKDYTLTLTGTGSLGVTLGDGGGITPDITGDLTSAYDLTAGEYASDVKILEGGKLNVYKDALASQTTVNSGGDLYVSAGGSADVVTVNFGGDLWVYNGATATLVKENGGYVSVDDGATVEFVPNSFDGVTLGGAWDWATVHSGTTATNIVAAVAYTAVEVYDGGSANNTTVSSGGIVDVYSGGKANGATIAEFGKLHVSSGGSAIGIVAEAGAGLGFAIAPGTYAQGTYAGSSFEITDTVADYTVNTLCNLDVYDGGTANNTTVSSGGIVNVFNGGKVTGVNITSYGSIYVTPGGSATGIVAVDGARLGLTVAPGTYQKGTYAGSAFEVADTVTDFTVHSGCILQVDGGGTADVVTVDFGGDLYVSAGGSADVVTVNSRGWLAVSNGATVTHVRENGGYVYIDDGATATFVSNSFGGYVYNNADDWCTIHDGTTGSNLTAANKGRIYVYSGGIASDTTVNDKGIVEGNSGGLIDGVVVNSGGSLLIYNGAKLTGQMTFASGAEVIPFVGSILDFDLTQTEPGSPALVNDLSILMGTPTYTLTVDNSQALGTYKLAGGAAGFDKPITVRSIYGEIGCTLTVDGGATKLGDVYLTLALSGSDLTVTIGETSEPDTTPPTVTNIKASTTEPTNQNVTVTADFNDNVGLKSKLYQIDGGAWQDYTAGGVVMTKSGTVYFKAVDTSDNESAMWGITVDNIDKVAPTITNITPSTTAPAASVTVTATFADDWELASRQYKIGDGAWTDYVDGVTVTENGTVYFKAVDIAGNEIEDEYTVTNIAAPGEPLNEPDDGWNDYLYDSKNKKWNTEGNIAKFTPNPVSGNCEILLDEPGTVDLEGMHNMFGNDTEGKTGNLDKGDVGKINVTTPAKLSFSVKSTADATFYIYEDGFDKKNNRAQLTVGKVSVKKGKAALLSDICLTTGENKYYAAMVAKNVKKPGPSAIYNVFVVDSTVFVDADGGWNNEATNGGVVDNPFTVKRGVKTVKLDNTAMIDGGDYNNFVGFSDEVDYAKLDLVTTTYLSFDVGTNGSTKFTLWKRDTNSGKLSKVGGVTTLKSKNGELAAKSTKAQLLEVSDKYEYFVSMESKDAGKGGSAYYNVDINTVSTRFFDSADGGANNWLFNKKDREYNSDDNLHENTLSASGDHSVILDDNEIGDTAFKNFVGFKDSADYAKVVLTAKGTLSFRITALADVSFELWRKDKDGKDRNILTSLQKKTDVKVKDYAVGASATTDELTLDAGDYYISVTAKSTKANEKGSAFYNVTAIFSSAEAGSLAMPETDALAGASLDSYLDFASDKLFGETGGSLLA